MPSIRRQTIEKWIAGFSSFDRHTVVRFRSKDSQHLVVPSTGQSLSQSQLENFFSQFEGITAGAKHSIHLWLEDDAKNTLAIWTTLTVCFQSRSIEDYVGDYLLVFKFTEDQTEYTQFLEFIDTATTGIFLAKVAQALEEAGRPPLTNV